MSLTLESVKAQEDACVLPAFDSDVAWEIGTIIRNDCRHRHELPAVVYIAHANTSHLLFCATSKPGTHPDNMHWVKRKEAVVLRWGMSTMRMRLQLELPPPGRCPGSPGPPVQQVLESVYQLEDPSTYTCRGGGFPIRVKNVEGIVGVIVVSGLTWDGDNHGVIVGGIQEYLESLTYD